MSLDISLITKSVRKPGSGIFVREDGRVREISRDDWDQRFPGCEPAICEIRDAYDDGDGDGGEVFSANITHNLGRMASEAGIYHVLWRHDENGITHASQMIAPLEAGLKLLKDDPERFKQFDSPNGWGLYVHFVPFVEEVLGACKDYPQAVVRVSR